MRKTKLIALLLVVSMMILSGMSVSANYDPTIKNDGGIPLNEWTVEAVYHWVVRGETLQGIADFYGTNIDEIKFYNSAYFDDLANRNKTTGLNIQLEHGVRLFIYHMVTVCHYVQRGDTLNGLANGDLKYGSFTLRTTKEAIIRENQTWFNDLADLNKTRGTEHELEESYAIWNIDPPNNFAGIMFDANGPAGNPLYISVPVQIRVDLLEPLYRRETYTFMANNGEKVGNPALTQAQQIPFPNTFFTNDLLPDNTGWTRTIGMPQNLRLGNYKISGIYGIQCNDKGVWW